MGFQCKSDEIDELLSKHNLATETITKLQTEKNDLASEFESYKKETNEKMEQIEEYERKTRDALEMVEAKESSVEDMKKLVEEATAEKNDANQRSESAMAEKVSCEMKQWGLEEKITEVQKQKEELENSLHHFKNLSDEEKTKSEEQSVILKNVQDQLTSSEKEVTDLKTKLNQAEEEKEK